jgi:hypothetical protein
MWGKIIILFNNWYRYSSSFWVEYFYKYYDDIIMSMYIDITRSF